MAILTKSFVKYLFLECSRLLLGGILVFAAAAKIIQPEHFLSFIAGIGIANDIAMFAGGAVVALELCLGVLLFIRFRLRVTLRLAGILFTLFAVLLIFSTYKGYAPNCGCFGSIVETRPSVSSIVRNVMLAALGFYAGFQKRLKF